MSISLLSNSATFRAWLNTTNIIINTLNANTFVAGVVASGVFAFDANSSLTFDTSKFVLNANALTIDVATTLDKSFTITSGAETFIVRSSNTTVLESANSTIVNSPTLLVRSNTTFQNAKTTFSGNVEFNGPVFTVGGNTFSVTANATFNTAVITNATIANLTLSGALTFSNNFAVTGTTTLGGPLNVAGVATFSNTVTMNAAVTMASLLNVTGNTVFSNRMTVANAATFSNGISVTGLATLASANVTGNTALAGVNVSGTLNVAGLAIFNSPATFANTILLEGNVVSNVVFSANATVQGQLEVQRTTLLVNTVTITGLTNVANVLSVLRSAAFSNTIAVTGNTVLGKSLTVAATSLFGNTVTIAGETYVDNNLHYHTSNVFSWNTRSNNTVYQAASDGFLNCVLDGTAGGIATLSVVSDANSAPTVERGGLTAVNNKYSGMVPIRSGDYYRATVSVSVGTASASIWWVPLGSAG